MNTRSQSRGIMTLLSCCAISLLGGTGHRSSSDVSNGFHTRRSGTAGPASQWDPNEGTRRVVVGEYITGLFCGVCQPHEHAFDSLLKRYPSTTFIALAYNGGWNVPISNPRDSIWDKVSAWYGTPPDMKGPRGVFPTLKGGDDWIDGHKTGGDGAEEMYQEMARAIDAELRKAPEAALHMQAAVDGGTIVTHVQVDSLSPGHADVYVRMLVVEDTVRLHPSDLSRWKEQFPRRNHYMVVRAAAGDTGHSLGVPLHGPGMVSYTFDLAKIQRQRLKYRELVLRQKPAMSANDSAAVDEVSKVLSYYGLADLGNWKIDPTRLHVVAFVQDARTGDILQAQMIHVDPGPQGELLKLP